MRTAVSGTFSVKIFVASSPSIPGMRTSMITTSGFRRSVSATAVAPSEASPTTRMCGARESDRRRPSRTTSWSSTIKQVISWRPCPFSATAHRIVCGKSEDGPRRRLRRRSEGRAGSARTALFIRPLGESRLTAQLDGEGELLGDHRRLGLEPDATAVADAIFLCQRADVFPQRLRLLLAEVGAPLVEALVAFELLGPVPSEVLEE